MLLGKWATYKSQKSAVRSSRHGPSSQPLTDFDDGEYTTNVSIGSPPQNFTVLVTTSTAALWVPDKTCPSSKCPSLCDSGNEWHRNGYYFFRVGPNNNGPGRAIATFGNPNTKTDENPEPSFTIRIRSYSCTASDSGWALLEPNPNPNSKLKPNRNKDSESGTNCTGQVYFGVRF